jgi:outer membrane protein OmpA-like peptidoglycan-associated protein
MKFAKIVSLLAMVVMLSACGISMDTIKYWNGSDKTIQAEPCEICISDPIPAKAKIVNIKEDIMFLWDSSKITADEMDKIKLIADLMKVNPDVDIVIDAYASTEGSSEYNMDLSQARANAVKAELVNLGIDASRIVTMGQGETNTFGKILGMNRRAVVVNLK